MSQSTVIVGVLLAMFFVFVTTKGELPAYLATLGL
jgi:hypothetical protein